ncbi:DUF2490 domain-containing protein [Hyphomonas sp.]|uniref:DUF2490 domain-containing protein n=1 Tax=Hyphomonas sp. TaxID=87 RepID=UPI003565CFA0
MYGDTDTQAGASAALTGPVSANGSCWSDRVPLKAPRSEIVSNELFVELNDADWGQESGIDRNGAFVGCGRTVFPTVRIEVGYLRKLYRIRTDDQQNRVLSNFLSPLDFEILSQKKPAGT